MINSSYYLLYTGSGARESITPFLLSIDIKFNILNSFL
uniref:Uncharacterized protein n=1 Tax=Geladintestivirus 4 TaxID=3233136 RepID=A0AAU8MH13_9CAUD